MWQTPRSEKTGLKHFTQLKPRQYSGRSAHRRRAGTDGSQNGHVQASSPSSSCRLANDIPEARPPACLETLCDDRERRDLCQKHHFPVNCTSFAAVARWGGLCGVAQNMRAWCGAEARECRSRWRAAHPWPTGDPAERKARSCSACVPTAVSYPEPQSKQSDGLRRLELFVGLTPSPGALDGPDDTPDSRHSALLCSRRSRCGLRLEACAECVCASERVRPGRAAVRGDGHPLPSFAGVQTAWNHFPSAPGSPCTLGSSYG